MVRLTKKQAVELGNFARRFEKQDGQMLYRVFQKVLDGLKLANAPASILEADQASRTKPCSRCGKKLVHPKGGGEPRAHHCPHGLECYLVSMEAGDSYCPQCRGR